MRVRGANAGRVAGSLALALLLAGLFPTPASAETARRNPIERVRDYTADLLIARPLGLVQIAAGAGMFVVAYPAAFVTRSSIDVVEICVTDPVLHTFTRPLGEL